jgi:hypothetical protein
LARRSLKPQLNQIRTWVRQGRTDAWIAHQLEVSVSDIRGFKREHELSPEGGDGDTDTFTPGADPEEPDLRAEDDALVAAELEAELEADDGVDVEGEGGADDDDDGADGDAGDDSDEKPKRRRRGRRGGRGRGRAGGGRGKPLEGTFDHGEEGYGLWLDPAVQDDPVYAEHWAGHRPVTIQVEAERIVITRAGEDAGDSEDSD